MCERCMLGWKDVSGARRGHQRHRWQRSCVFVEWEGGWRAECRGGVRRWIGAQLGGSDASRRIWSEGLIEHVRTLGKDSRLRSINRKIFSDYSETLVAFQLSHFHV